MVVSKWKLWKGDERSSSMSARPDKDHGTDVMFDRSFKGVHSSSAKARRARRMRAQSSQAWMEDGDHQTHGNWLSRQEQSFLLSDSSMVTKLLGIDWNPRFGGGSKLLHPESPFLILCNFISCICLIWTLIVEQIELGFFWHTHLCDHDLDALVPVNIFVDIWFLFEILLTCVTGMFIEGRYVDKLSSVVKAYISGQFWFDLLTCLPGAIIQARLQQDLCVPSRRAPSDGGTAVTHGEEKILFVMRLLRPIRLFRLMRMMKMGEKLDNLHPKSGLALRVVDWVTRQVPPFLFPISKCFLKIFLIVHTCVCLFWLVKEATIPYEEISLWVEGFGLDNKSSFLERYALAFYYVNTIFTTVGFGDVTPLTNEERMATIILMYMGVFVFSLLMSEVQEAVTESLMQSRNLSKVLIRCKLFLNQYEVPAELSQRVLNWVAYDFKIQQDHAYLHGTLQKVPMLMRRILFSRIHRDLLYKVPSFAMIASNHREDFLVDLFACLKPKTLPRFLPVTIQGAADSLCCIIKGVVHAELKGALLSTMRSGDTFGEHSLLSSYKGDLVSPGLHCEFVTDTFVHLLELSRDDFVQTVSGYNVELREEIQDAERSAHVHVACLQDALLGMESPDSQLNYARWWCMVEKVVRVVAPDSRYRLKKIVQKMKSGVVGGWSHAYHDPDNVMSDHQLSRHWTTGHHFKSSANLSLVSLGPAEHLSPSSPEVKQAASMDAAQENGEKSEGKSRCALGRADDLVISSLSLFAATFPSLMDQRLL